MVSAVVVVVAATAAGSGVIVVGSAVATMVDSAATVAASAAVIAAVSVVVATAVDLAAVIAVDLAAVIAVDLAVGAGAMAGSAVAADRTTAASAAGFGHDADLKAVRKRAALEAAASSAAQRVASGHVLRAQRLIADHGKTVS